MTSRRSLRASSAVAALMLATALTVGITAPAAVAQGSTAPAENLEAVEVHPSNVLLTWELGSDGILADEVQIWNRTTGKLVWYANRIESWRIVGLEPGQTYRFEVVAWSRQAGAAEPTNEVTVTTPSDDPVEPPSNLEVTAYSNSVRLTWEPATDDPDVIHRIYDLATGRALDISSFWDSEYTWTTGFETGESYEFHVTTVTPAADESAPSNRVAVTTPHIEPPTDFEAAYEGDTVTLSWSRPAAIAPHTAMYYRIRLNGEPETLRRLFSSGPTSITIPAVERGTTHEYTIQVGNLPEAAAAPVAVPAAADTTPPTTPVAVFGRDGCDYGFTILEESTDDTTPSAEIRYEVLSPFQGGLYVVDYDVPRSTPDVPSGNWVRAVDAAGNRTPMVSIGMHQDC